MAEPDHVHADPALAKLGANLAIVGVVVALVGFVMRPLVPDPTDVQGTLRILAENVEIMRAHALVMGVGEVLILLGIVGLRERFRSAPEATSLARFAMVLAVLAATVGILGSTIDGHVVTETAAAWQEATAEQKPGIYQAAGGLLTLSEFVFTRTVMLWGSAILLLGWAVIRRDEDPPWVGGVGAGLGALVALGGAAIAWAGPRRALVLGTSLLIILLLLWVLLLGFRERRGIERDRWTVG